MRRDERPVERDWRPAARFDVPEDREALFLPREGPGKDRGEGNDKEAVGYVCHGREPRLQSPFKSSVRVKN